MTLDEFLRLSWDRYRSLCPDAERVHALLRSRGETVVNDHVAFRTFHLPGITRRELGSLFEQWGYQKGEDLQFPEKKLEATYWLPPRPDLPKVFISELLLERCSAELRAWVESFASPDRRTRPVDQPKAMLEPVWREVSHDDYLRFYPESEYAAWAAAFGIQVNHFTVSVNALQSFATLEQLNDTLLAEGFTLNRSGGLIKGSPSDLLEQSSTQARPVRREFAGGKVTEVPDCYYEFARRYMDPSTGLRFEGFVPKSADKIFESTAQLPTR